ncbi:hypothetical protein [Teredinibacter haidensis]|uniref:hypothetical protein n=1 Tax=Teredinibacter haidensis TaxID=2731755 RepID=UPI0009488AA5|nr:hypothetical protein [Teredinibacter haidensis]
MDTRKLLSLFIGALVASSAISFQLGKNSVPPAEIPTQLSSRLDSPSLAPCTIPPFTGEDITLAKKSFPETKPAYTEASHKDEESPVNSRMYTQVSDGSQQIETFSSFIEKAEKENKAPMQLANERFEAEEIDYNWATSREDELFSMFDNHEALQDIAPLSVICKTKNCQVILATEGDQQANILSVKFSNAISTGTEETTSATVSYFVNRGTGELIFYLSEDSSSALFQ